MNQSKVSPKKTVSTTGPEHKAREGQKAAYASPTLVVYGSVSNLTRSGQGTGADGGAVTKNWKGSDRSIKENIARIGDHAMGIGLYLYDYKPKFRDQWGHGRQLGVMADEVEAIMPEAVTRHPDGYRTVNYGLLGLRHHIQ